MNVLLLENISQVTKELFENNNCIVEHLSGSLNESELIDKIKNVNII